MSGPSRPHVLIALENEPYPHDRRVRQEAEALRDAGYDVTVCGPAGLGFDARREQVDGVEVRRYPTPPGGEGALGYLREYAVALAWLTLLMQRVRRERRVDVVLVCNPPDLTVLPALPLRRAGAALIFDHHDLSPELFEAKFDRRGLLHKGLKRAERFALRSADVVIATTEAYAEVARERAGVAADRIFVVRNGPDPTRIYPVAPVPELRQGHDGLVAWVGVISSHRGLELLVEAADELVNRQGRDIAFALVGPGDGRLALQADTRRRGLGAHFIFPGREGDERLRQWMASADVCVGVDQPNAHNDACVVTKILEYMAMGRPIVQFKLRETRRVCGDASVYAHAGNSLDLARRIGDLLDDPAAAAELGRSARARALDRLLWPQQVPALLESVGAALELRAGSRA